MKVAVTGSHGYIGSVLTAMLLNDKHEVVDCDMHPHNTRVEPSNSYTFVGTFEHDEFIERIVSEKVEVIFHLAASSLLGPSATDPLLYYHNNAARTILFLKKLIDRGWKGHIVFSSTAAVYGETKHFEAGGFGFKETAPTNPINHYGHSKLMCEKALEAATQYGIKVTIFRYFNVAGSYQDTVGQRGGEPHIITRLCNAAAGAAKADQYTPDPTELRPVTVFGRDYKTSDGTCVRDYVHVVDVCRAQMHAWHHPPQTFETYNLGTQRGTTVRELLEVFEIENDCAVPHSYGPRREGDPAILIADPSKFSEKTGFTYTNSNLKTIVKSAWNYFNYAYTKH